MSLINAILYIFLALFWGGSFVAIKIAVATTPPLFAGFLRVSFAAIFLAMIYLVIRKPFTVTRKMYLKVWLGGIFSMGIPFSFLFWGERLISPGLGGVLNGTAPMWTFIFGLIFMRKYETFSKRKVAGLCLGIFGLGLIFGPKLGSESMNELLGTIAVTIMAISYGIGTIINRSIFTSSYKVDLHGNLFQQVLASVVYLFILTVAIEGIPHVESVFHAPIVLFSVLYLGCVSTAIAFLMYFRLIRDWGGFRASTVAYLVPLVAVFLDFVINGQKLSHAELAGVFSIVAGVIIIQLPGRPITAH